ncbi:MAG: restriction endonuclease subunit S [Anaerolineales bacterium]
MSEQAVPKGYKKTEVGVIPEDWKVVSLGDVADIYSGATPSTQVAEYWNGTIPWCTPTDITSTNGKYLFDTGRKITPEGLASCGATLLPKGALLLCSRATIGEVKIAATEVSTNQGFKSLVCKDDVDNEYVYYLLLTLKSKFIERANGSTFLEIGRKDVIEIPIPLPPLPEQRAIAAALSDVDALLAALDALIAKKRAVKQAAMQALLTGRVRLPGFTGAWKKVVLGDHVKFLKTGSYSRAQLTNNGPVKYLHYGDIHAATAVWLDAKEIPIPRISEEQAVNLNLLQCGDVVFVDASEDLEGVGKSVEITDVPNGGLVAGLHTIAARFDKSILADGFKGYLQLIPDFRRQLLRFATGTKVYAIQRSHIAAIEINLPDVDEQRAIAAVLSDMDAEIAALEARREKVRQVKQGMMQVLLTGKVRLVEQDEVV